MLNSALHVSMYYLQRIIHKRGRVGMQSQLHNKVVLPNDNHHSSRSCNDIQDVGE